MYLFAIIARLGIVCNQKMSQFKNVAANPSPERIPNALAVRAESKDLFAAW